MDRNELRQAMVAGIDRVLNGWGARFISDQDKRLLKAQRSFALKSDKYIDALLLEYQNLPLQEEQSVTKKKQPIGGDSTHPFTEEDKKKMGAFGFDWSIIASLIMKAPQIATKLKEIWDLIVSPLPMQATKEGCCNHAECCQATAVSAFNTLCLALKHLHECCEECDPDVDPKPSDGVDTE